MLKFVKGKLYSNFLLKILKNYHNKNFQPEKIIVTIIVIILKKGVFLKLFSGFHFWTFLKCPFFIFLFTFWNFFVIEKYRINLPIFFTRYMVTYFIRGKKQLFFSILVNSNHLYNIFHDLRYVVLLFFTCTT